MFLSIWFKKALSAFWLQQIHILKALQNEESVERCNVFCWGTEKRTAAPCRAYSKHTEALMEIWEAKKNENY